VGFSYESPSQAHAHLDAKGIEMVRRDQCPAVVKMQEQALRILFLSRDLSELKRYLVSQWQSILVGGDKINLRDFIFQKEVKYGKYRDENRPPVGAVVAYRAVAEDPRAEPPYRWRVPYVVVSGSGDARLYTLVQPPEVSKHLIFTHTHTHTHTHVHL
jgi:DNA polymerase zeta